MMTIMMTLMTDPPLRKSTKLDRGYFIVNCHLQSPQDYKCFL